MALKKNIRRSSILDKSLNTNKIENLNILETSSTSSTESFPSLQLIESQNNSIILIPDSDVSASEDELKKTEVKSEVNHLLPEDKLAAISDWVSNINVNVENSTISSVYTELSTICGTDFANELLEKEKGHAVNSTFVNGHDKKFEEVFGRKNNFEFAEESNSSDDNVKNVIEDSFEILNQSLRTRLKISRINDKLESEIPSVNNKADGDGGTQLNDDKWTSIQFSGKYTYLSIGKSIIVCLFLKQQVISRGQLI